MGKHTLSPDGLVQRKNVYYTTVQQCVINIVQSTLLLQKYTPHSSRTRQNTTYIWCCSGACGLGLPRAPTGRTKLRHDFIFQQRQPRPAAAVCCGRAAAENAGPAACAAPMHRTTTLHLYIHTYATHHLAGSFLVCTCCRCSRFISYKRIRISHLSYVRSGRFLTLTLIPSHKVAARQTWVLDVVLEA